MYGFRTSHLHSYLHMEGQLTGTGSLRGKTRFSTMFMEQGEVTAMPVFPFAQVSVQGNTPLLVFLLDHTYILCPDGHKSVIMTLECTEKIILSEHVTAVKISAFHSKY